MTEATSIRLDLDQLREWGMHVGRAAAADNVFVALIGPLGAGKTTLVQAACEGAGVAGPVTSPTFTLVHRYGAERPVYHADLYRIEDASELPGIGWEDLTAGDAPVFVEWAERAGDWLPRDRWEVRLSIAEGGAAREARVREVGEVPPVPGSP